MNEIVTLAAWEKPAIGRWSVIGIATVNLDGIKTLADLRDAAQFAGVSEVMLAREVFGWNIEALHEVLCHFCFEELGMTELGDGTRVCNDEQCIDEATAPVTTT